MLLEIFINPILSLVNFLINSLPVLALPVSLQDGLTSLLDCWNSINAFVPVNYVLLLCSAYWIFVNGKLFVAIIAWIYEKIPFI